MKLTRYVIKKRSRQLKVTLEKDDGRQRWEFYLRLRNPNSVTVNTWKAEGDDE